MNMQLDNRRTLSHMRRGITIIAAAAGILLAGCTPEEIEKAERVAARMAAVDVAPEPSPSRLRPTRLPTAEYTEVPHRAWLSCGPITLHVENTGTEPFDYEAWYGVHQSPLTWWVVVSDDPYVSHAPNLQPGETAAIDLSPAIGDEATLFLNQGMTYIIDVTDC